MDWGALVPTLVGGGISALTTAVVLIVNYHITKRRDRELKEESLVLGAYSALKKLMRTANSILSIAKHFDEEFNHAHEIGLSAGDPAHFIRQIAGNFDEIVDVSAEESAFLSEAREYDLLSSIWEIESRAKNHLAILQEMNELQAKYHVFLENVSGHSGLAPDVTAHVSLEGQDAITGSMYIGKLNSMIGSMVEHLEEDRVQAKDVVEQFVKCARERFGEKFPMPSVKWKS